MSVLDEAKAAVEGPRACDYGPPHVNHGCTAVLVRAYLRRKYGETVDFDALDVCAFNILQKLSRLAHTPDHHDSLVDIAGYAANWDMILATRASSDMVAAAYLDLASG